MNTGGSMKKVPKGKVILQKDGKYLYTLTNLEAVCKLLDISINKGLNMLKNGTEVQGFTIDLALDDIKYEE